MLEVGRGSSSQVEYPVYEPGTAIRWEEERTHTHAQPKFTHACTHVVVRGAYVHVYTHVVVCGAYMFTLILLCVVHTCLHSCCCVFYFCVLEYFS